ncbi:MAG TPA: phosphatase PAP2 family protein [Solirubrobacteraceae bacterium]|nr:phosphatase PAP2 family protein [Solirubrobacteraceae bacterium]
MDVTIVHALNAFFAAHDGVEDPVVAYVNAAEMLFRGMLVAAFLLVGGHLRRETRRAVVAAGIGAGVALALAQVISGLVDRPRPFVDHPGLVHLFAHHAADPGFPSDHTTAAFAIGVALLLRFRLWGAIVLALATVLAVGRVAMAVHYPTDVLGGAALGTLVAVALWAPPARAALRWLADTAGALVDGATGLVTSRVRATP